MKKSYILYPNLSDEEITPENGKFIEAELAAIVGPAQIGRSRQFIGDAAFLFSSSKLGWNE